MGHLASKRLSFQLATKTAGLVTQESPSVRTCNAQTQLSCYASMARAAVTTCIFALVFVRCGVINAQTNPQSSAPPSMATTDWATGFSLTEELSHPTSVSWTDAPFADRVKAFASSKRIAVFIDRRLDPGSKVNIRRKDVTIEQLFMDIADQQRVGMCRIGDIVYFGPVETAQGLPITWHELKPLRNQVALTMSWPAFSTPENILMKLGKTSGLRINNKDFIRHDFWSAGSYPPLTPIQQIALIAIGFNSWPVHAEHDSNAVNLIEWTCPVEGTIRVHRNRSDRFKPSTLKRTLKKQFPHVKFQVSRRSVQMSGQTDDLYAAKRFLIQQTKFRSSNSADVRFSLKTSASRIQILEAIAKQTDHVLNASPAVRTRLSSQIKLECHQLTLEELVSKILHETPLEAEVSDNKILIMPK